MRPPTRRAALAVCAALLLVTAGCSGGANPTSTATTTGDTPTDATTTPPTETWSPNASVEQYPPGVADNGTLVNASALVDAHFEATANRASAFTVEWDSQSENGVRRYVRSADGTPYYSVFNRTSDGVRTTEQFYATGSHGYSRVTVDDETVYRVYQNNTRGVSAWTQDSTAGPRDSLSRQLASGNYSVNGTVERGGQTFVQLSADEVSQDRSGFYAAYEGTVLVTPEGVVHEVDASHTTESDGETVQTEASITVDTDVEWSGPPSWVGDLPQLSLSIVEGGQAVEIRNTGGTALPADTSFDVVGSEERTLAGRPSRGDIEGTITLDASLEPGDAVYVTAGADGSASSFALHDEPTRGEYTFGSAGLTGGSENVYYRLATGIQTFEDE
ncbi:hypothetical protein [Halobacterium litoreum]|uniref:Uncharacterized protein n=1 Tax=Halobacterium litoreum TaxID=2039234 RepID=A0ABD5NBT2_9EURY|nr:hypothetical protein [Halobacterium litoreum]UHH14365.1 hypothetical protein LT972_05035 [Halobacterium litoreum]